VATSPHAIASHRRALLRRLAAVRPLQDAASNASSSKGAASASPPFSDPLLAYTVRTLRLFPRIRRTDTPSLLLLCLYFKTLRMYFLPHFRGRAPLFVLLF
jgi:hypothetical protein